MLHYASPVCTMHLLSALCISCLLYASPVCTMHLLSALCISCLHYASPVCADQIHICLKYKTDCFIPVSLSGSREWMNEWRMDNSPKLVAAFVGNIIFHLHLPSLASQPLHHLHILPSIHPPVQSKFKFQSEMLTLLRQATMTSHRTQDKKWRCVLWYLIFNSLNFGQQI